MQWICSLCIFYQWFRLKAIHLFYKMGVDLVALLSVRCHPVWLSSAFAWKLLPVYVFPFILAYTCLLYCCVIVLKGKQLSWYENLVTVVHSQYHASMDIKKSLCEAQHTQENKGPEYIVLGPQEGKWAPCFTRVFFCCSLRFLHQPCGWQVSW